MNKTKRIAMCAVVLLLGAVRLADAYDANATRYDTTDKGKKSMTFSISAGTDSTFAPGWIICTASAFAISGTALVQPIFDSSRVIRDPGAAIMGLSVANPRAGQALMSWDPDSLFATSSSRNTWSFCCGDAKAIRVKALSTCKIRVWMSGRCQ